MFRSIMFGKARIALVAIVSSLAVVATASGAGALPGSGWWTGEQVQNVGAAAGTVSVTAYDSASASTFSSASIPLAAGGSHTFSPTDFAGMTSTFLGSAVVSSDQPIKAIVNVTNQQAGGFGIAGGKAAAQYQGTESTATTLYFPLTKNNRFGATTAYYIQNAGTSAATAHVTFKMDNGSTFPLTTPSIGPSQMVVVVPSDAGVPNSPSNTTRVNVGSATVTSTQPLAGTVLEFVEGQAVATVLKGTRALTAGDFSTKAYAPVAKNTRFTRFTGIQVQNVSGSPINIDIKYVGSAPVAGCQGVTFHDLFNGIAPGASHTTVDLPGTTTLPVNCTAAATISGTGNFVAIVNEDNTGVGSTPSGSTYFALPDPSTTTKVSAPLFKDHRFAFSTGLQIENVGASTATNVVATFQCKGNNGANTPFTAISNPQTIVPGGAKLFIKPDTMPAGTFTGGNPFNISGANCGVIVTADQKIVAILNESPDTAGALDDNNYEGFNIAP